MMRTGGHRRGWADWDFDALSQRNHAQDQDASLQPIHLVEAAIDHDVGCQPEGLPVQAADGLRGFRHAAMPGVGCPAVGVQVGGEHEMFKS